jgi:hypothetical protein
MEREQDELRLKFERIGSFWFIPSGGFSAGILACLISVTILSSHSLLS